MEFGFWGAWGKPESLEINPSEQGREPTTTRSTYTLKNTLQVNRLLRHYVTMTTPFFIHVRCICGDRFLCLYYWWRGWCSKLSLSGISSKSIQSNYLRAIIECAACPVFDVSPFGPLKNRWPLRRLLISLPSLYDYVLKRRKTWTQKMIFWTCDALYILTVANIRQFERDDI